MSLGGGGIFKVFGIVIQTKAPRYWQMSQWRGVFFYFDCDVGLFDCSFWLFIVPLQHHIFLKEFLHFIKGDHIEVVIKIRVHRSGDCKKFLVAGVPAVPVQMSSTFLLC